MVALFDETDRLPSSIGLRCSKGRKRNESGVADDSLLYSKIMD